MTAPQELRTARLLLRSFERGDIPAIVRLAGTREIAATTLHIPHPYDNAEAEDFLARMDAECRHGNAAVFAVTLSSSGELCGACGLHVVSAQQRAELGYWIGVPYWGRGFGTEAAHAVVEFGFNTLGLHRIHASHFAGNAASGRVLEKIGMLREGRSREHVRKWGGFVDLENYGLLAAEFRSAPSKT
jgi:[ribosomal protein S5]-alanine N-acetyltransferase